MQTALVTRLKGLRDIASLINAGSDLATILERIVAAVCRHTAWAMSGIMKVNVESGFSELMVRHDVGQKPPDDLPTRWRLSTSPALRVVGTGTPLIIPDAQVSDEFPDYRADAITRRYHTVVVLPVAATDADGNHMVLSVQSRETTQVGEMELAFLTTVAHLGAIAVEKAKRLEAERAQSERLRRTLAVNESLLARALAGDSLTNLLGTVEVLLPEPFLVVDLTTHSILARRSPAQNMINAVDWQRFVRRKAARLLMDLAQDTAPDGFGARTMIDFAPCGLGLRLEALVSPMRIDQEPVGALVLFPAAAVGDPLDLLLAQETSRAINVHLLRSYERERSRVESAGELISALIQGAPLGSEAVWSRAEQLGVNLAPPGCLLAIGLPDATPPQSGQHYRALSLLTSRLWPGALIGPQGVDVTVLLPGAADRLRHVTVLAKQIVRELTWRGTQPAIAISEVCHGLADYPRAWRASRRLLALGRSFGRSGVLSHDAFGPFAELLATMDGTTVQDFVTRTLGNAGPGNAGQHERLLETVANFLDHGCRYQASADSLGIHVSTLRYRIGRFQEATSTDLTDPDTCFSLALALRLRQLHQTGMTAS